VRTGENAYRISLALAGFSLDEISITAQQNRLTVAGSKAEHTPEHQYLHQGIAARPFERQFNLEDHVEVEGASFENGLLQIELARKIPEAMKPRRVEIGAGASTRKTEKLKAVDQVARWTPVTRKPAVVTPAWCASAGFSAAAAARAAIANHSNK
jgi:molecular chaperone IbpA